MIKNNKKMDVVESISKSESFKIFPQDSSKTSPMLELLKNTEIDKKKNGKKYEVLSDLRKMLLNTHLIPPNIA